MIRATRYEHHRWTRVDSAALFSIFDLSNQPYNIREHHAVRTTCGVFDVSHMTVVDVAGGQAKAYLQTVLANDVAKLSAPGQALYSAMLNPQGGVIDDLIVFAN